MVVHGELLALILMCQRHPFEGALDVSGADAKTVFLCGLYPGGSGNQVDGARDAFACGSEQFDGRRLKAIGLDAGQAKLVVEVGFSFGPAKFFQLRMGGDAGVKRTVASQPQG